MSSYRHQRSDFEKFIFVSVGFLVLSSALNWSTSSAYTTDTTVYAPPDYLTFQPPDAGGSYTDPVFGTAIKRLTNSMTATDPRTRVTLFDFFEESFWAPPKLV